MPKDRQGPIRVVVVDDSPTFRDFLASILEDAGDIQVVGTGVNGEEAVRQTQRLRPDVVTLDIRMPKLDGLEATRRIMRETPTPIVIVTGSLMRADTDLTFEALRAGALTVIAKPGLADLETCEKVVQTVRLMADVPVVHHWGRTEVGISSANWTLTSSFPPFGRPTSDIRIIGIAASTGGPAALATVLGPLPADFPLPILVVQHVTRGFTAGLAEWLNTQTALCVGLAGHGDTPQPGTVLVAPGDYHLQMNLRGVVELCKDSLYKGLRPSANFLFRSLARTYGSRAMGIMLTGMGDDGAQGLDELHRAGGWTIAQDEPSCVVYGMPREAVARNAVDQVLSPEQIALALSQLSQKRTV